MDNYINLSLWATPIYVSECEIKESEIEYIKGLNDWAPMLSNNASITKDKKIFDNDKGNLSSLKQNIMNHVNQYIFDQLKISKRYKNGFYIATSWVNRIDNNQHAPIHVHGNSLFSGVVYIDFPEGSTGGEFILSRPAQFDNILPKIISFEYDEFNELNCSFWTIPAVTNRIVIFPSLVQHEVAEYHGDKPRYSLAFNVFYKGNVGSDTNELDI